MLELGYDNRELLIVAEDTREENTMERRLPHEPKHLVVQLTAWIEWRYARSQRLVLTSAPTSLPSALVRWKRGAVWRLVWQTDGSALLYGLAPSLHAQRYFVVRFDTSAVHEEGEFERLPSGGWRTVSGDTLMLRAVGRSRGRSVA